MASLRKAAFEHDPWLAHVLKRPAYRWTGGLGDLRLRGPGFYHARLATSDVTDLKAWFQKDFRLVDVSVTAERYPLRRRHKNRIPVRPLVPSDAARLRSWAGDSFSQSRFHLDPKISDAQAHAVKRAWVEEILSGRRADKAWVGLWKGQVAGFLARRTVRENGLQVAVLDLMAVHPSHRGRGIGEALVRCFVQNSPDCAILRVGTQAANAPSLRLYERCGFTIKSTQFVLHAHLWESK